MVIPTTKPFGFCTNHASMTYSVLQTARTTFRATLPLSYIVIEVQSNIQLDVASAWKN